MSNRARANRKRIAELDDPVKTYMGWMQEQTHREIIHRREWNKAIKGLPKDKVPIADVKWLRRPLP